MTTVADVRAPAATRGNRRPAARTWPAARELHARSRARPVEGDGADGAQLPRSTQQPDAVLEPAEVRALEVVTVCQRSSGCRRRPADLVGVLRPVAARWRVEVLDRDDRHEGAGRLGRRRGARGRARAGRAAGPGGWWPARAAPPARARTPTRATATRPATQPTSANRCRRGVAVTGRRGSFASSAVTVRRNRCPPAGPAARRRGRRARWRRSAASGARPARVRPRSRRRCRAACRGWSGPAPGPRCRPAPGDTGPDPARPDRAATLHGRGRQGAGGGVARPAGVSAAYSSSPRPCTSQRSSLGSGPSGPVPARAAATHSPSTRTRPPSPRSTHCGASAPCRRPRAWAEASARAASSLTRQDSMSASGPSASSPRAVLPVVHSMTRQVPSSSVARPARAGSADPRRPTTPGGRDDLSAYGWSGSSTSTPTGRRSTPSSPRQYDQPSPSRTRSSRL